MPAWDVFQAVEPRKQRQAKVSPRADSKCFVVDSHANRLHRKLRQRLSLHISSLGQRQLEQKMSKTSCVHCIDFQRMQTLFEASIFQNVSDNLQILMHYLRLSIVKEAGRDATRLYALWRKLSAHVACLPPSYCILHYMEVSVCHVSVFLAPPCCEVIVADRTMLRMYDCFDKSCSHQ